VPQPFAAGLGIVVEAAPVLAAEPFALDHHLLDDPVDRPHPIAIAEVRLGGLQDLPGKVERDLVVQGERTDRHAGHPGGILDQRRRHALPEHVAALGHVGHHHPRGEEAARVVDDDRRLADLAHEIDGLGQRPIARRLATDDFDELHPVDR
jgi:hypothetical protein